MSAVRRLAAILAADVASAFAGSSCERTRAVTAGRCPTGDSQLTQDWHRRLSGWGGSRNAFKAAYDSPRAGDVNRRAETTCFGNPQSIQPNLIPL
jgi:hypothetical protein